METFFAFGSVLILGFGAGYAVRAFMSRRRRMRAKRAQTVFLSGDSIDVGGRFSEPVVSAAEHGKTAARVVTAGGSGARRGSITSVK